MLSQISSPVPDTKPASDAEIGLIMSVMVLGKTIDDLNLQTTVTPKYLPVVGAGWARLMGQDQKNRRFPSGTAAGVNRPEAGAGNR